MAYVRKKRVNGYEYYQLVESYRENGKVRQRMLAHLSEYPTVEAAMDGYSRKVEQYREISYRERANARALYLSYMDRYPRYQGNPDIEIPRSVHGKRSPYKDPHASFHKRYWRMIDTADEAQRRGRVYKEKLGGLNQLVESGKVMLGPWEVEHERWLTLRAQRVSEAVERLKRLYMHLP